MATAESVYGNFPATAPDRNAAGWLRPPTPNTAFGPRARLAYLVNPRLRVATM
jgi:hypothetical protein